MKAYWSIILFLLSAAGCYSQSVMESIVRAPIPEWVKQYPRAELQKEYKAGLVLIHDELQYNHVSRETFTRQLYFVNTIAGRNEFKALSVGYDPIHHKIALNEVRIYRGDETIDLHGNLHTEFFHDISKFNGEEYSRSAKISIFLEKLKVGDVFELSFTRKGDSPQLGCGLNFQKNMHSERLLGKSIVRLLSDSDSEIHWTLVNLEAKVKKGRTLEFQTHELVLEVDENPEVIDGPVWMERAKMAVFTDQTNWEETVGCHQKRFELDKPPAAIVKEKTEQLLDSEIKEVQVKTILDFVQMIKNHTDDQLIEPEWPETVLEKGHGNKMSKISLAVKMLECIEVDAWPVLVKKGGLDKRYVDARSAKLFDHAILEFVIGSDTLLFDGDDFLNYGTVRDITVDDFRYGLPIREGVKELTKYQYQDNSKLIINATINANEDKETGASSFERESIFIGRIANEYIDLHKRYGVQKVAFQLQKNTHGFRKCSWREDELSRGVFTFNADRSQAFLLQEDSLCRFHEGWISRNEHYLPEYLHHWVEFTERGDDDNPGNYMNDFRECEINYVILAEGKEIYPDTFRLENEWLKFEKITRQGKDSIFFYCHLELLKSYAPLRSIEFKQSISNIYERSSIFMSELDIASHEKSMEEERNYSSSKSNWKGVAVLSFFGISILMIIWWIRRGFRKRNAKIRELEKIFSENEAS